jgi:hypothetical protein
MRRWLERCEQRIFVVFRIGSLLTLLLLTRSRCIIILGSGSKVFLPFLPLLAADVVDALSSTAFCPGAGISSCRRSSRVIQLACSTLLGIVQLITDDHTAWSMTPAMDLVLTPKCPTILAPGVSNVPPTCFTPWTKAMFPFSRLTRMTPLGLLQQSTNSKETSLSYP